MEFNQWYDQVALIKNAAQQVTQRPSFAPPWIQRFKVGMTPLDAVVHMNDTYGEDDEGEMAAYRKRAADFAATL